jgi:hypothetical protein
VNNQDVFETVLEAAGIEEHIDQEGKSSFETHRISLKETAGPYLDWLEPPHLSVRVNYDTPEVLMQRMRVSRQVAENIIEMRKERPFQQYEDLLAVKGIGKKTLGRLFGRLVTEETSHPHLLNLELANEHILAYRPYALRGTFLPASHGQVELLQVTIFWAGTPYSIQKRLTQEEIRSGHFIMEFGKEDYLPVGPVRFQVRLFDDRGGSVEAGIGTYVLPSNPLSVNLTPGMAHYRSWIVRARLLVPSRAFETIIDWTVSNTTGGMRHFSSFDWVVTDGGSHVETVHEDYSFSVQNNGTSSLRTVLTSPSGSPTGRLLNRGGDFTLRINLRDDRGVTVTDTIVVQPWLGYNLNIVRVGSFQSGDRTGLRQGANLGSSIYQQINLTQNRLENNWYVTGDVSQWEVLDSNELGDLLSYASVPNDGIDMFVVSDFTGGTGISPNPGACSKGGSSDGLVIDRRYTASGELYWRGMGQTMAHELGHYFDLDHTPNDSDHDSYVMHPVFRENRTFFSWDEYYEAYRHCMVYLIH